MMKEESLEEMNSNLSSFHTQIKDTEEMMKANDLLSEGVSNHDGKVSDLLVSLLSLLLIQTHCNSDPECSFRVQISSQPDPQMPSGALIHVPRYLGNLPFRVWKKMQDIVQNSESGEDLCRYTYTGSDA
ncbi:hypothetical protein cypCar_00044233 [Cyprinus carpio]|nr:hypothetical protein cypCar_00044233 [Cyprinus carpio]